MTSPAIDSRASIKLPAGSAMGPDLTRQLSDGRATVKGGGLAHRTAATTKDSLETIVAELLSPSQLLKFGSSGKPGFRSFQVTPDLLSLGWVSANKKGDKTRVDFKDMKQVQFGQRTEIFRRNNRTDLETLSFSIIYNGKDQPNKSLDLVCKDEREFQRWTTAIQGILDGKVNKAEVARLAGQEQKATTDVKSPGRGIVKPPREGTFQGSNDVYSFGWGEWGQLGTSSSAVTAAGAAPATPAPTSTTSDASEPNIHTPKLMESLLGKGVIQVACGWAHSTVLLETGAVLQYGGKMGTGMNEDFPLPTPVRISEKLGVLSVACGAFHTAAVTEKGHVYTWGCNVNGQLGHGDNKDISEPKLVEDLMSTPLGLEIFILHVVCGAHATAALGDDGHVYTWGAGANGMLGHNDTKDELKPKAVKDLLGTDITKIAAGDSHMFACTKTETYAWGWNGCGQLGLDHEEEQHRPQVVEVLRGQVVEDISCGAAHSVAIVYVAKFETHMVYSWGCNSFGQLGQGKKKRVLKPFPVGELSKVKPLEVMCGSLHTLIRTEEGDVWSTGCNKSGQLGHGHTMDLDEFKNIEFLKGKHGRLLACGGMNSAVVTARAWVEDSEAKGCMSCKGAFTFVNRRHHCRNCGGVFCNACSSKKVAILKYGLTEPVRVCASCYVKLGGR